jgi:ABC-type lipoprotein release transport system permease subunit
MKRRIILIGCRGEVPNLHKDPRKPLVQPVPSGTTVLGYDLHQSLGLEHGQKVRLMGREYTVHKCNAERGSKDDITVWVPLEDAQELLGKEGHINAILALKCLCLGDIPIERMRAELAKILPETRSVEFGTRVLARAEARLKVEKETKAELGRERRNQRRLNAEREHFASLLVPGLLLACAVWIALTAFINARGRGREVAILRATGYRARQILALFLSRSMIGGLLGGLAGCGAVLVVGENLRGDLEVPLLGSTGILSWEWFLTGLFLAPVLGVIAGWFPALMTSQQDPAQTLREE